MWEVRYLDEAVGERKRLPTKEMNALDRAVDQLEAFGPQLPYPHQSDVRAPTICASCGHAPGGARGGPSIGVSATTS